MVTREFELQARYDARKSFYGKAHVIVENDGDDLYLRSYNTRVAHIHEGKRVPNEEIWASATTNRHIREFYKQFEEV